MPRWKNLIWPLLLVRITLLMGQSQPVQHCYFSELTFSADSSQLFFQSVYCEEGEPLSPEPAWISFDLKTHALQHLNPQPIRFVPSPDKSVLLFSSRYGLFRMNTQKPHAVHQLVFWNPARGLYLNQLGFLTDNSGIGWTMIATDGGQHPQTLHWSTAAGHTGLGNTEAKPTKYTLHPSIVQGPETISQWRQFSEYTDLKPIRLRKLPEKSSHQERLEIPILGPLRPQILLNKIRPRLISLNPDSSVFFISVLDSAYQARSFVFDAQTGKKLGQLDEGFNFMCWLGENQLIGVGESGLFHVIVQPWQLEKMLPMSNQQPNLTRKVKNDIFRIITSTDNYRRSRIVMKTPKNSQVLVPEWIFPAN